MFIYFLWQLLNNLIVHCDFYSCAPWLWFFNIPKLQILFALDPDFTGNSLLLYTYFTLILIACYCKFDSHSFENANQTHFMWLLQVRTSVYVPMWVFIVRLNASLTDLGNFPLGSWWCVQDEEWKNPTLWPDRLQCLLQPAPLGWPDSWICTEMRCVKGESGTVAGWQKSVDG